MIQGHDIVQTFWASLLVLVITASGCTKGPEGTTPEKARDPAPTGLPDPDSLVKLHLLQVGDPERPTFDVAAHFEILPGWHIYWTNPGETGIETKVTFEAPGYRVSEPRFTVPERFESPGAIASIGYHDQATVFATLTKDEASSQGSVAVEASWLVCADVCIRGKGRASLRPPNEAERQALQTAQARLPAPLSSLPKAQLDWESEEGHEVLRVRVAGAQVTDFLPGRDPALAQARFHGDTARLGFRPPVQGASPVTGLLKVDDRWFELRTPWVD